MSGRKNHHVPQLLQRGFGLKQKKAVQVCVFSKDKPSFTTSTANFGAERDFYIHEQDRLADNLITDFEGEINEFFQRLREADQEAVRDTSSISTILAHLEMRSKFLREEMSFVTKTFVHELRAYLYKPQNIFHFIKTYTSENPDFFASELDKLQLNSEQRKIAEAWIDVNFNKFIQENSANLHKAFEPIFEVFYDKISETVKSGHLKALKKSASDIPRNQAYLELEYTVLRFEKPSLILPDTMVAFLKSSGRATPFLDETGTVVEVYMPLTSQSILYGYRDKPTNRSVTTINRILASCSAKNFIAHDDEPDIRALTPRIGKNAAMISKGEMQKIIRDVVRLR